MKPNVARILVRPPSRPSASARTLREALGDAARISRISPIPRQYKTLVNWGNPHRVGPYSGRVLNKPENISNAINKLQAMRLLQGGGVRVPTFHTTPPVSVADRIYLARHSLTGSGGVGIQVVRPGDSFPSAPLYTEYVKKLEEVRVHVFQDKAIFCQFKKRKSETEQDKDQKLIRNYDKGWVFCPRDVGCLSDDTQASAVNAVLVLGLDFGAVDIVIGKKDNLAYVLEVNTAPGLESPGLIQAYADAVRSVTR